ncbi:MAG TPA: winged helix DNA-binding domain-containing protein [Roseiflexaceae bacterium]|nr:winged helix DNA-binding domain-containing protein [Roseiflexaceae bacterium]
MTHINIALQRLVNQQVAEPTFTHPSQVVQWLGAVQAQDYLGALWAVGLRLPGATEQDVEQALAEKAIVRTWPMRGTIHFVAPADVRWMQELLAPRVVQGTKSRYAQLGLDEETITASARVLTEALQGGRQLTRNALYEVLEQANIATKESRGLHILGRLAHDRLLCFGARAGKQPTFALLDEWVPEAKSLPRDEALARLAQRYFTSHGPATLQDFVWWAGLRISEARAALQAVASELGHETIDGQEYHYALNQPAPQPAASGVFLLPPFDEYLVAYRDRSASLDAEYQPRVVPGGNGIFNPIVVTDGRVTGLWKRTFKRDSVIIMFSPFTSWSEAQAHALAAAAKRYAQFVGKTAIIEL